MLNPHGGAGLEGCESGLWFGEGFVQEGLKDQVALGRQRGSCPGSGEEP